MMTKPTILFARIPLALKKQAQALARKDGRSLSSWLRRLLERAVKEEGER